MNILEASIKTYWLSTGKLLILYQVNLARIILVYSDLNYVKCFQLYDCELNEDTVKRIKDIMTEEFKIYRVKHIYFSYSISDHHDVEILSYIVDNFQRINLCGFNVHSKGVFLLNVASKIDFKTDTDPSTCLVDFLAAVLHNNVQGNSSTSYLSMLSEKVHKGTKKTLRNISTLKTLDLAETLRNISTLKTLDLANNNMSDYAARDIELFLSSNHLEEIYLGRNNLQDSGIVVIAEALEHNSLLITLDISHNNITREAAGAIAQVLSKQVKLEKLILAGNNLQDGLVMIIDYLKCYQTLKLLDISNNRANYTVTDKIATTLCFHTRLKKLCLGGNNLINTETLQALQYFLAWTAFDISCSIGSGERKEDSPVRHVVYMQALLLAYVRNMSVADKDVTQKYDLTVDEYYDDCQQQGYIDEYRQQGYRLPAPTAELSLKSNIAKILWDASKCVTLCTCVCVCECVSGLKPGWHY